MEANHPGLVGSESAWEVARRERAKSYDLRPKKLEQLAIEPVDSGLLLAQIAGRLETLGHGFEFVFHDARHLGPAGRYEGLMLGLDLSVICAVLDTFEFGIDDVQIRPHVAKVGAAAGVGLIHQPGIRFTVALVP